MLSTVPSIAELRLQAYLVVATIVVHGLTMVLNELFFVRAEFLQGIGWVYIPAGTRLICTLLFGSAGAVGLLMAGWAACYWYYFPGDATRAVVGAIAGAAGPYLVYWIYRWKYGTRPLLSSLSLEKLLICSTGCAFMSPALHHIWFMLERHDEVILSFFVMFVGDLAGTLIVLLVAKTLLPRVRAQDFA